MLDVFLRTLEKSRIDEIIDALIPLQTKLPNGKRQWEAVDGFLLSNFVSQRIHRFGSDPPGATEKRIGDPSFYLHIDAANNVNTLYFYNGVAGNDWRVVSGGSSNGNGGVSLPPIATEEDMRDGTLTAARQVSPHLIEVAIQALGASGLTEARVNELIRAYGQPFTSVLLTKLNGIQTGAQVNRSIAEIFLAHPTLPWEQRIQYGDVADRPDLDAMIWGAINTLDISGSDVVDINFTYEERPAGSGTFLNVVSVTTRDGNVREVYNFGSGSGGGSGSTLTGAQIASLLEALQGSARLDYSALDNTPTIITNYNQLTGTPTIPTLRTANETYALIQSLLNYNDLSNPPTIPTLRTGAETVALLNALPVGSRIQYSWLDGTPSIPVDTTIFFGPYAANTAIPENRIVTYGNDVYWTRNAILDTNTTAPDTNANFEQLDIGSPTDIVGLSKSGLTFTTTTRSGTTANLTITSSDILGVIANLIDDGHIKTNMTDTEKTQFRSKIDAAKEPTGTKAPNKIYKLNASSQPEWSDDEGGIAFTGVALASQIPSSPNAGDLIRFTATVSVSGRSDFFEKDGTTAVTSAESGQEYRRVGSNWIKLDEETPSTLEEVGTSSTIGITNDWIATGITPTADQMTDDTIWVVSFDSSSRDFSAIVSAKQWKALTADTAGTSITAGTYISIAASSSATFVIGRTSSNEILVAESTSAINQGVVSIHILRAGGVVTSDRVAATSKKVGEGNVNVPTQAILYSTGITMPDGYDDEGRFFVIEIEGENIQPFIISGEQLSGLVAAANNTTVDAIGSNANCLIINVKHGDEAATPVRSVYIGRTSANELLFGASSASIDPMPLKVFEAQTTDDFDYTFVSTAAEIPSDPVEDEIIEITAGIDVSSRTDVIDESANAITTMATLEKYEWNGTNWVRKQTAPQSQFTPTKANLYSAVKEILHPQNQNAVTADDANNEIDIATGTGGSSDDIVDLTAGIPAASASDEGKIGYDAGGALYTVKRVHNDGTAPSGTQTTVTPQNTSNFRGVQGRDPANPVINQWYYNYYTHEVKLATEPGEWVIWVTITANFAGTNTEWLYEHNTLVDALRSIRNYNSAKTYYYFNTSDDTVRRIDTYVAPVMPHTDYRWQRVTVPLTKSSLYAGVKAILHPSDQAGVTADDANSEIDLAIGTDPRQLILPPPLQVLNDKSEVTRAITETVNYANAVEDSFFIFSNTLKPHRGVGSRVRLYNEVPNMNPISNVTVGTQSPDTAKEGRDLFDAYYIDRGRQFRNEWKMAIGCEFTYAALSDDTDTPSAISDDNDSMGDNGQSIISIREKSISNTPNYYPIAMIDRRDSDAGQLYGVVASGTFFEAAQVARTYLDIGGQKHSVVKGSAESTLTFTVPTDLVADEFGISFELKDEHGYAINSPIVYLYAIADGDDTTTIRLNNSNQELIKNLSISLSYTSPNLTVTVPALNATGENYQLDVSVFSAGAEQVRHRYATHTIKNYQNTVGPVDQTVPADVWHKLIMIFRDVGGNLVITPVIQMADGTKVQINVINTGRRISDLDMSDIVFGDPAGVTVRNIQGFGIKSTVALDSLPSHTVLADWIDNTGQVWDQITGTETLNLDVNLDFELKGTGVIERIAAALAAANTHADTAVATAKEELEAFARAFEGTLVHWDGAVSPIGGVLRIEVDDGGSGYTSTPTVVITPHDDDTIHTTATATAVRNASNVITRVNVTNHGVGYTKPPTISFTGGGGSGAEATAIVPDEGNIFTAAYRVHNGSSISSPAAPPSGTWEATNKRWRVNYRQSSSARRVANLFIANDNLNWGKFEYTADCHQVAASSGGNSNGALGHAIGMPNTGTPNWSGDANNGVGVWINRSSTNQKLHGFIHVNDDKFGQILGSARRVNSGTNVLKSTGSASIIKFHNGAATDAQNIGGATDVVIDFNVTGNSSDENAANRYKIRVVGAGRHLYVYINGTLYVEVNFPITIPGDMGPRFGIFGDTGQDVGLRSYVYQLAAGSPSPGGLLAGF